MKDIEDLTKVGCPKNRDSCEESCNRVSNVPIHVNWNDDRKEWHKIFDLKALFDILSKSGNEPYMLVAGDTAHGDITVCTIVRWTNCFNLPGVYRRSEDLRIFIDVNDVVELRSHSIGNELVIGANVNLTETMDILSKASTTPEFEYCKHLVKHIDLVANVPVRNVCTSPMDCVYGRTEELKFPFQF